MKSLSLMAIFGVFVSFSGCRSESDTPQPTVASAAEAMAAFASEEDLSLALERRWPISAIKEYCIPERRNNGYNQNLVTDTDVVWEGALHSNADTGFDVISWYATTEGGRAKEYSLNVQRGADYWNLEIGSERTLTTPPNTAPDPNQPGFVGHK